VDRDRDDGEEVLLLLAAMDATALAHTRSSRFIRFSSPQIIGSTGRSFSVVRKNTGGVPDTSPPPPPAAKNSGRSTVSASRAIDDPPPAPPHTHHNLLKASIESYLQLDREHSVLAS
jgi:hypothetical protein